MDLLNDRKEKKLTAPVNTPPCIEMILGVKSKISLFNFLNDKEIKEVLSESKIVKPKRKEILYNENEVDNRWIYYILRGSLKVLKKKNNSELFMSNINGATLVGEVAALTNQARTSTVIVDSDNCVVIAFKLKDFKHIKSTTVSKLHTNIIETLSKKISSINDKFFNIEAIKLAL